MRRIVYMLAGVLLWVGVALAQRSTQAESSPGNPNLLGGDAGDEASANILAEPTFWKLPPARSKERWSCRRTNLLILWLANCYFVPLVSG